MWTRKRTLRRRAERAEASRDEALRKLAQLRVVALELAQQADPQVGVPFDRDAVSPDRCRFVAKRVRQLCGMQKLEL